MAFQPRIVFMGSPDFAVPTLLALVAHYLIVGVVTQPDRPAGRGGALKPPAVKEAAIRLDLPILQPEKIRQPEAMDQLRTWAPDLIVVIAFGQILRSELLDLPKFGCINVHGSLLPRWRGAAPIQAAIMAGDTETGITIMKMDSGVDTGAILRRRSISIAPEDTTGTLFSKLAPLGANLLLETLPSYLSGELAPQPQPFEGITYAPMLKKEDGRLDFNRPANELERRIRAMNPWPGAFFEFNGNTVRVQRGRLSLEQSPGAGNRFIVEGFPAIGTGEGVLILEEIQPASKKTMAGKAFLAGSRGWKDNE